MPCPIRLLYCKWLSGNILTIKYSTVSPYPLNLSATQKQTIIEFSITRSQQIHLLARASSSSLEPRSTSRCAYTRGRWIRGHHCTPKRDFKIANARTRFTPSKSIVHARGEGRRKTPPTKVKDAKTPFHYSPTWSSPWNDFCGDRDCPSNGE